MTHAPLDSVPMELLRTCDVPCLRYTSYPTALQFDEIDPGTLWCRAICSGESDDPISLYLHIPLCQKLCWYCA